MTDMMSLKGPLTALVLETVAGIGAGQAAQRQQPRHEAPVGVRFAGRRQAGPPDRSLGEVPLQLVVKVGGSPGPDRADQAGDNFPDGNQPVALDTAWLYSPMFASDKTGTPPAGVHGFVFKGSGVSGSHYWSSPGRASNERQFHLSPDDCRRSDQAGKRGIVIWIEQAIHLGAGWS